MALEGARGWVLDTVSLNYIARDMKTGATNTVASHQRNCPDQGVSQTWAEHFPIRKFADATF
jgi:hypothetical protein